MDPVRTIIFNTLIEVPPKVAAKLTYEIPWKKFPGRYTHTFKGTRCTLNLWTEINIEENRLLIVQLKEIVFDGKTNFRINILPPFPENRSSKNPEYVFKNYSEMLKKIRNAMKIVDCPRFEIWI